MENNNEKPSEKEQKPLKQEPVAQAPKEEINNTPEVEQELSQVATNPKQSIIILVVIVLIFAYLFFNFFINSGDDEEEVVAVPKEVVTPVQTTEIDVPTIPALPTPPKLEDLEPPAPPLPPETPAQPGDTGALPPLPGDSGEVGLPGDLAPPPIELPTAKVQDDAARKRREKKIKSNMILIAGQPPTKTAEEIQQESDFKHRGDMNLVLGRGKILDAVVESAISTDFGGEVRAVINKDTYSEWGKNILIPKGSRVFGVYTTDINGAYGRVSIMWTRIDLANGYSVTLDGMSIDGLGKKGQEGQVDNKFRERLTNAVLRSAFDITLANVLDKIVKPQINSQAAATRNLDATNIKNIANTTFTQAGLTDAQKRTQICAQSLNALTDKTSATFIQLQTTCNNLASDPGSSDSEKLLSLMSSINTISDSLIKNTDSNVEETKAQSASKEGFENISDTLKSFVEEQDFKPTITIDQGTAVKIYVNRDYKFPKKAVAKRRKY